MKRSQARKNEENIVNTSANRTDNTFKALMRGVVNAIDRPGIQRIVHQKILARENVDANR